MKRLLLRSLCFLLLPALLLSAARCASGAPDSALQAWITRYNSVLQHFSHLPVSAADKLFLSESSPLARLQDTPELSALREAVTPALNRLDMMESTPQDDELFSLLCRHGIGVERSEGSHFLVVRDRFFQHQLEPRLSLELRQWLAVRDAQPRWLYEDAGLAYSLEETGQWAVSWEHFIDAHPDSPYVDRARGEYFKFLQILMFCTADNTPAFSRHNGGRMSVVWRNSLTGLVQEYPGTRLSFLLKDYLAALGKEGFKLSDRTRRDFERRLEDTVKR